MTRQEVINYSLTVSETCVDYPFADKKYGECPVIKHKNNKKWFAIFMKVGNDEYLNVKTNPDYSDILRNSYDYIIPAYHMNKEHWNTIIINRNVDKDLVKELVQLSYELTIK